MYNIFQNKFHPIALTQIQSVHRIEKRQNMWLTIYWFKTSWNDGDIHYTQLNKIQQSMNLIDSVILNHANYYGKGQEKKNYSTAITKYINVQDLSGMVVQN